MLASPSAERQLSKPEKEAIVQREYFPAAHRIGLTGVALVEGIVAQPQVKSNGSRCFREGLPKYLL